MNVRTSQEIGNGWGKVYAWWRDHPAINADRFCVLATLATYADRDGYCDPSQATIAKKMQRSRPWVNGVVASLAQAGFIEKTARRRRHNNGETSCLYRILSFDEHMALAGRTAGEMVDDVVTTTTGSDFLDDSPRRPDDRNQTNQKQIQPAPPRARKRTDELDGGDANVRASSSDTDASSRRALVPKDWTPSRQAFDAAQRLCPAIDVATHATMFSAKSRSKGYAYLPEGIDDAWLAWLMEDRLRGDLPADVVQAMGYVARKGGGPQGLSAAEMAAQRSAAWALSARCPPLPPKNPWS